MSSKRVWVDISNRLGGVRLTRSDPYKKKLVIRKFSSHRFYESFLTIHIQRLRQKKSVIFEISRKNKKKVFEAQRSNLVIKNLSPDCHLDLKSFFIFAPNFKYDRFLPQSENMGLQKGLIEIFARKFSYL